MSALRRKPAKAPAPGKVPATSMPAAARPRRLGLAGVIAGLVLAAALVAVWVQRGGPAADLPTIDLARLDPTVAATIQRHLGNVRSQPKSGSAWGALGIVLREYGFKPEARGCLSEAERLDPKNPRWPYHQGLLALIGAPAEAVAKLRRTVQLCGSEPEAPRYRLAKLLGEQGKWDEAAAELAALLETKTNFAPARLLSAQRARAQGDYPEATRLAEQCTDDPRTGRAAWGLLATLYRFQNHDAKAANAARRSAALPADEGFGDPFEAEVVLLRGDPRALTEYAHPLLAAGRLGDAAPLIDQLRKNHPTYPDTWLLAGRLHLLRKEPSEAEQALRRHLELDPRSVQGLFQLGTALLNQNRLDEAAETFLGATRIKLDFGPAYFNRGLALARAGRRQEAIAAFQETIRHNPEHVESYFLLADLHFQLGNRDAARQLLDQAELMKPGDPRLKALRGRMGR